ncbi:unnamed protein product [Caenorhabditis brenneri]
MKVYFVFAFFLVQKSFAQSYIPEVYHAKCGRPCIFQPYHINSETLKSFPTNCTSACAYLLIDQSSDVTESQLTEAFKNMKTLYGTLDILKTNFKNVKFLAGLETVECETDDRLRIDDNDQMTEIGMTNLTSTSCEISFRGISGSFEKLNLPKLKNFYTLNASLPKQINMRIDGLSNFCLTVEEVTNFLSNDFLKLQIGRSMYCKTNITEVSDEKLCQIQNFTIANFDTTCKRVLGIIIIKPGDEEYVNNLKSVTWVYGRILIFGTSLKSIDFFDSLEYVAEVDTVEFSIHIRDNEQLESVALPKLKKVIGIIRLEGNHKNLFPDPSVCFEVNDSLNLTVFRKSTIDDSNCRESCYTKYFFYF